MKTYKAKNFFDDQFPFAVIHTTNPSYYFNKETRFNREFFKITLVGNGHGYLLADNNKIFVHKNTIYLVHPAMQTTYDISNKELEVYNLLFSLDFIKDEIEKINLNFNSKFWNIFNHENKIDHITPYVQEASSKILSIVKDICLEYHRKENNYQFLIKNKLVELLILLERNSSNKLNNACHDRIVQQVNHILSKNYQKSISLDDIAKTLGISKNYLCHHYKTVTSNTIVATHLKQRLEYAAEKLKKTMYPIAEISQMYGFNDISFFYRAFKKQYGDNPGQYRKKYSP